MWCGDQRQLRARCCASGTAKTRERVPLDLHYNQQYRQVCHAEDYHHLDLREKQRATSCKLPEWEVRNSSVDENAPDVKPNPLASPAMTRLQTHCGSAASVPVGIRMSPILPTRVKPSGAEEWRMEAQLLMVLQPALYRDKAHRRQTPRLLSVTDFFRVRLFQQRDGRKLRRLSFSTAFTMRRLHSRSSKIHKQR